MITISKQPPLFNYSKNPIVIKANTNKYYLSAGSKAYTTLVIGLPDSSDLEVLSINLKTNLFSQKITFKNALGNTSTNIVIDGTVINNATFATFMAKRLNQNYYLNRYYIITITTLYGYPAVKLTAKNIGTDYSITTTVSAFGGAGYDIAGINAIPSNVQILLQVFEYDTAKSINTNALEIGSRTIYPDKFGNIEEDVSDIIDDFLTYEIFTSDLSESFAIKKSNNRFFITISELGVELAADATVNAIGILNTSIDFYTLKGGVDKVSFIANGYDLTNSFVSKTKTFLTDYPGTRTLYLDQPHILYFIHNGNNIVSTTFITAIMDDGTEQSFPGHNINMTGTPTPKIGLEFQIPILITAAYFNYIETLLGKKIVKLYTQVFEIVGISLYACSEKYYFDIDKKYYKNFNQLILKNSKGAYEPFFCKGAIKATATVDFQILNKTIPAVYTTVDVQQSRTNPQFSAPVIINTGHLKSREEKKWLVDLLIQGEGFHVIDGVLVPIVITNSKILISDTTEDTYSFDIEFTYSYTNTSYTA